MSAAFPTAAPPNPPGPVPDPATTPAPSRTTRVLVLLRNLVDYGLRLTQSLQQRPAPETLFTIALHFGTRDIALILARILRGLELAFALEGKLARHPRPEIVKKDSFRTPADRKPRTDHPAARRPPLPDRPTAAEIAAALRNRPVGVVIADICRDLGIVPANPLWRDVMAVLNELRRNVAPLVRSVTKRLSVWRNDPLWHTDAAWAKVWAQVEALWPTGPPDPAANAVTT